MAQPLHPPSTDKAATKCLGFVHPVSSSSHQRTSSYAISTVRHPVDHVGAEVQESRMPSPQSHTCIWRALPLLTLWPAVSFYRSSISLHRNGWDVASCGHIVEVRFEHYQASTPWPVWLSSELAGVDPLRGKQNIWIHRQGNHIVSFHLALQSIS